MMLRFPTNLALAILTASSIQAAGCRHGGCAGSLEDKSAAKSSAGGPGAEPRAQIVVKSGHPDRDCIYDVIVDVTDDEVLAEQVHAAIGASFDPPGVLFSSVDEKLVWDIHAALLESGCDLGDAKVVKGKLQWTLAVEEAGTGANCMIDVLVREFPGTDDSDWQGRVSAGQTLHTGRHQDVARLEVKLEQKCGCKLAKDFAIVK